MAERTLYFFRHGQTDWNLEHRLQGHQDIPLNATGLEQAAALAARCAGLGIGRVVSSDLARAAQTARAVARACGAPLEITPALREICMGEMEGRTVAEFLEELGEEGTSMWFDHVHTPAQRDHRFPGGESRGELSARVIAEVERTLATRPEPVLAFSTHGGSMRRALGVWFGDHPDFRAISNAALYEVCLDTASGQMRYVGPVT
jgi:probable phosphoglycerate mutase